MLSTHVASTNVRLSVTGIRTTCVPTYFRVLCSHHHYTSQYSIDDHQSDHDSRSRPSTSGSNVVTRNNKTVNLISHTENVGQSINITINRNRKNKFILDTNTNNNPKRSSIISMPRNFLSNPSIQRRYFTAEVNNSPVDPTLATDVVATAGENLVKVESNFAIHSEIENSDSVANVALHDSILDESNGIGAVSSNNTEQYTSQSQEWIPPNRPLIGDVGQSYTFTDYYLNTNINRIFDKTPKHEDEKYDEEEELRRLELEIAELERLEQLEESKIQRQYEEESQRQPDWLQLRRSIYGDDSQDKNDLSDPSASSIHRNDSGEIIPCKPYTLLTYEEILECIHYCNGYNAVLIRDDVESPRMGGIIGLIVVSAHNLVHMRRIGSTLVQQMRKRKLHERGVIGAYKGIEGDSKDILQLEPGQYYPLWFALDCHNYVVHIQDETTRAAVDLEGLWTSGGIPVEILSDEAALDAYIDANPVPDSYTFPREYKSSRSKSPMASFTDTMQHLRKSRNIVNKPQSQEFITGTSKKNRKKSQKREQRRLQQLQRY